MFNITSSNSIVFVIFAIAIGVTIGGFLVSKRDRNIENGIKNATLLIGRERGKINDLEYAVKKFNKDKENMLINQRDDFLQNAISTVSKPTLDFIDRLKEEYRTIVSKYYLEEFGGEKINNDMEKFIEGKFPNTFSLSNNFHKKFGELLLQISDEKPAMTKREVKILFGQGLNSPDIRSKLENNPCF